jgi:hypothetical protein
MVHLAPELTKPHPAGSERERESVIGGKKYLCLAAAARAAPRPPGPRALCEVGLAAFFFFCGPF